MGTAAFDQRIHGFWLRSRSRNTSKSTQALSSSGSRVRGRSRLPIAAGFLISEPPHSPPAVDLLRLRSFSRPSTHSITVPRTPAPPATVEYRAESSSALGRHEWRLRGEGSQAASRARLQEARWFPRLRATPRALTLAGRGQEGRESWPALPLTQCREAGEGRRAGRGCPSLSSWERHGDLPRVPGVAIPSPRTKTAASERQLGPLPIPPPRQGAGSGKGLFPASVGSGALEWVPSLRPGRSAGARASAAFCLRPLASSGRQRGQSSFRRTPRVPRKRVDAVPQVGREKVEKLT